MRDLDLTETPRLRQALPPLREALIAAAEEGRTLTYAEGSRATGGVYPPRSMGRLLDLVGDYCAANGEPDLAVLVLRADEGGAGASAERRRVWRHWGGADAEQAGSAREAAALEQVQREEARRAERRAASPTRAPGGPSARPAARSAARSAAPAAARPEPRPAELCPRCFTVKSASGACACD